MKERKTLIFFLLIALFVTFIACGNNEAGNNELEKEVNEIGIVSEEDDQPILESEEITEEITEESMDNEEKEELSNSYSIDGITISADSFSIEPYEGGSGEYTRRIVMNFTIKNESDSAFGYITSWSGRLNDGYKLESWMNIMNMDLKQVTAGSEKTDTAYFLIDDSIDPEEIIVSYDFMDYNEEYWEDFGKIMSGQMGQEEYMDKWGDYDTIEFIVTKEQ